MNKLIQFILAFALTAGTAQAQQLVKSVKFAGATSGTTVLQSDATAGGTLQLPTVSSTAELGLGLTPVGPITGTTYAVAANAFVAFDTTSNAIAATLPSAPADKTRAGGKLVTLGGTNAVTISCGGTDVFNKAGGGTTYTLSILNQAVTLQYAAGSPGIWYVISNDLALSQMDARYAQLAAGTNAFTATSLTGVNSVASVAGTALTLGTGTFGTGITLASATGAATLVAAPTVTPWNAAGIVVNSAAGLLSSTLTPSGLTSLGVNSITAQPSTDLTLNAGSGANNNINLIPVGSGAVFLGAATTVYGRLNLPSSTSATAGIAWGSDCALYRSASGTLTSTANIKGSIFTSILNSGTNSGQLQGSVGVSLVGAIDSFMDIFSSGTSDEGVWGIDHVGHYFVGGGKYSATNLKLLSQGSTAVTFSGVNATFSGNITVSGTTASTSTTTGSGVFGGGVGMAGNLWVGGTGNFAGVLTAAAGLTVASGQNLKLGNAVAASTPVGTGTVAMLDSTGATIYVMVSTVH